MGTNYRSIRILLLLPLFAVFIIPNTVIAQFTADFTASPKSGTAPLTVTFTDQSQGTILGWFWSFPGASPSTATGKGPHVVSYNNPGGYDVTLIILGHVFVPPQPKDTKVKTNYINVNAPEPDKDFGDAPDDSVYHYPTLKKNNGAYHIISDAIYLGLSVDADDDGQPDINAEGDDNYDDLDDDDGVVFSSFDGIEDVEFTFTAHGDGYLNGWIDFNCDGDWEDEGEHIFKEVNLHS